MWMLILTKANSTDWNTKASNMKNALEASATPTVQVLSSLMCQAGVPFVILLQGHASKCKYKYMWPNSIENPFYSKSSIRYFQANQRAL
jgi:hypothetical protein